MFEPISVFARHVYGNLRDLGAKRAHAATVAGVSYKTAQRLDDAERRCGMCGRPRRRGHR